MYQPTTPAYLYSPTPSQAAIITAQTAAMTAAATASPSPAATTQFDFSRFGILFGIPGFEKDDFGPFRSLLDAMRQALRLGKPVPGGMTIPPAPDSLFSGSTSRRVDCQEGHPVKEVVRMFCLLSVASALNYDPEWSRGMPKKIGQLQATVVTALKNSVARSLLETRKADEEKRLGHPATVHT